MKILSVDDSMTIHRIVDKALGVLNIEVVTAKNVDAAEKVLDEMHEDIKLLLLDWNMPGRTGLSLLQTMKENDQWKEIPVIMLTSEGSKQNVEAALSAGASGYVVKPFAQEDLVGKVMQFLNVG